MTRMTFAEAARRALADEMRRDPLVWALGEDLVQGGIFGQYKGLADEFGADRIVSTPISEATIMGAGLGAALCGTRPIVEMRIADFTLCAMDELVSQIAKVRYMFGGQGRAALVVRMPQGMWRNSAAQHSQCLEAWLTHIPGLVVVAPGTAADAAGLLKSAIRSDDPVVLMEPKNLWTSEGEVADDVAPIPFGAARHAASGDAATVVTWSACVPVVEQGARRAGSPATCSTCAACGRGMRRRWLPRCGGRGGCWWFTKRSRFRGLARRWWRASSRRWGPAGCARCTGWARRGRRCR